MKNIKKQIISTLILLAMVFGGVSAAYAESGKNMYSGSFHDRLNAIVMLISIIKDYPEMEEFIKPIVREAIQRLVTDVNNGRSEDKEYKDKDDDSDKDDDDESIGGVKEIEAEPYKYVDNKWKVKVKFDTGRKATVYVYDIDNDEELIKAVAEKIESEFGIELSYAEVKSLIDIEHDDNDDDDDKYDDEDDSDDDDDKDDDKDDDSDDDDLDDGR